METNEQIERAMEAILQQMQKHIALAASCEQMAKEALATVSAIAKVWVPDVERVLDEHFQDITALVNSQEFIGKGIAGIKKEIDLIKQKIG